MVPSAVAWSLAGVIGAGGAAGTWSYLYFSESQRSSGLTGLTFSNASELANFSGGKCSDLFLKEDEKNHLNKPDTKNLKWNSLGERFKEAWGSSRGCLSVSWDKQTWADTLWRGIIKWEWVFSKGGETVVIQGFTGTDSFTQHEKLYIFWRGRYINKKTGEKVSALWNKQVDLPEKVRALVRVMPGSPNFPLEKGKTNEKYWGFNPDYTKVRRRSIIKTKAQGEELPTSVQHFEGKWKWTDGGTQSFSDLSHNLNNVFWQDIPFTKHLLNVKKGTWESF